MSHRLHLLDAFVDGPFSGNPAAVVELEADVDAAWMQQVAAELDKPATAFLRGDLLRWFTPTLELDLCGHGTVATAHVLWSTNGRERAPLTFRTHAAGSLAVRPDGDGALVAFAADPSTEVEPPAGLADALGAVPVRVARGEFDHVAELADAAAVAGLAPDMAALARVEARMVIATAAGGDGVDITSRVFGPRRGIAEDPATGSAHRTLGSYWAPRLRRDQLRCRQASARGGLLAVRIEGDRVLVGGRATTIATGTLTV